MDRVTRAKLDSLVHLLATSGGRGLGTVDDVARRLQLDPMIVLRVAEEQGVALEGRAFVPRADSDSGDAGADPNQMTQVMSFDEVHQDS
jgi:hypothetical protein